MSAPAPKPRCSPSGAKTRTSRLASTRFWRWRKPPARPSSSIRSSHRAALEAPASSLTLEDGSIEERVRLIRPLSRDAVSKARLAHKPLAARERGRIRRRVAEGTCGNPADPFERDPSRDRPACCPSGSICRARPARSTGFRPTTASASSDACLRSRTFRTFAPPSISTAARRFPPKTRTRLLLSGSGPVSLRGGLGLARFDRHERQAHRTHGLPRYRSRAAQELRLLQRNHLLAPAPVSARGIRHRRRYAVAPLPAVSAVWRIRWRKPGGMTWARHPNLRAASATKPRRCAAPTCRTAGARDATGSSAMLQANAGPQPVRQALGRPPRPLARRRNGRIWRSARSHPAQQRLQRIAAKPLTKRAPFLREPVLRDSGRIRSAAPARPLPVRDTRSAAARLYAISRPVPGTARRDLSAQPAHHRQPRLARLALSSRLLLPRG